MIKRMFAVVIAIAVVLSSLAYSFGSTVDNDKVYLKSGTSRVPKFSKTEIAALVKTMPVNAPDDPFTVKPDFTPPYSKGEVSQDVIDAGLARLNAMRLIAGVPDVSIDEDYTEKAQAAALVTALNGVNSHDPKRPEGMNDSLYELGKAGAGASNLYYCGRQSVPDGYIAIAVDGWMEDDGKNNLRKLGHRRWQLNPEMSETGFGVALKDDRAYVAEYAVDKGRAADDYSFISWPASGNFPANDRLFDGDFVWSVSLNPEKYMTPKQEEITVTLKRIADGKAWVFAGSDYEPSSQGKYFGVDDTELGLSNSIIFRPDGINSYDGRYQVEISGIKDSVGKPVDFAYQVEFFDPDNFEEDTNIVFSDVPLGSWYHDAVYEMASRGVMCSVGNNLFDPNGIATCGQYFTMITQLLFDEMVTGERVDLLLRFMAALAEYGLDSEAVTDTITVGGRTWDLEAINAPCTRYDLAQITQYFMTMVDLMPPDDKLKEAEKRIGDYISIPEMYRSAVSAVVAAGYMSGTGGTYFGGERIMTRAEAATVLCRFIKSI